jgi:TatD DNase family protein
VNRIPDTHCHLQDPRFDEDRGEVLARALDCLDWIAVVGDTLESSAAALALARSGVFAVVGVHPYHAEGVDDSALSRLRDLAAHPAAVALGETGLDYFNEFSPRAAQRPAFERQLALAAELSKPVVIHNREADADCLAILRDHASALPAVVMHCFGSGPESAEAFVELGCFISFAGNLTFPKAQKLRDAAAIVPLDRLLAETDAPYLAPQPRRGKRCEPADVLLTAAELARVKGVDSAEMTGCLAVNARRAFGIADAPGA